MLLERCDVCGEAIVEVNRENGQPALGKDEMLMSISFEPVVQRGDGTGLSKRYVVCSTECVAQMATLFHLCWHNPKYKEVPVDHRLEAFINGELKPLRVVETEAVGEPHERTTDDQPTNTPNNIRQFPNNTTPSM